MPELPDITIYIEALEERVVNHVIEKISIRGPSLLRTFEPAVEDCENRAIVGVRRIGKRIVFDLDDELFIVIHLMIAGRFRWKKPGLRPSGKIELAAFNFEQGTLVITEAGTKKRASLHVVQGEASLREYDRGGLDVLAADRASFANALRSENHTVKRSLTDPRLLDGIGNAYSDEILFEACVSPLTWTSRLTEDEIDRLFEATRSVLTTWTERLRDEFQDRFPGAGDITAFRPDFAVHGKFGEACPRCGKPVQRIVYASNETNYCAKCQTKGKILADRSLSRLLKDDWPRELE